MVGNNCKIKGNASFNFTHNRQVSPPPGQLASPSYDSWIISFMLLQPYVHAFGLVPGSRGEKNLCQNDLLNYIHITVSDYFLLIRDSNHFWDVASAPQSCQWSWMIE